MILFALAATWLAGVAARAAGIESGVMWGAAFGGGVALGFGALRRGGLAALVAAGTLLFVLGALRLQAALPPAQPGGLASYNGGAAINMRAIVAQEPDIHDVTQRALLRVSEIDDGSGAGWQPSAGRVLATLRPFPRLAYGDAVEVSGRLETPPVFDEFDYQRYLALRGIASTIAFPEVRRIDGGHGSGVTSAIIDVRDRLGDALSDALPEPEAALSRGMLLGQRASIPDGVTNDFNTAGISHLIAISGSNVTIVANLTIVCLAWIVGRRPAVVAAMGFVVLFVLLVGATPSVLRAAVMGIAMLGAVLAGRPGSALTAVAVAGAAITAVEPLAALDVSFQLSFAATVGLIVLAPPLETRMTPALARALPDGAARFLSESVSVTTAASIAVFPITAGAFHRVSLVAIPANIVAVPLFTATIALSAVTAAAGVLSGSVGSVAGRFAFVPLWLLVHEAHAFATVPYASSRFDTGGFAGAVAFYLGLGAAAFALVRRPRVHIDLPRLRPGVLLLPAAMTLAAAVFVWLPLLRPNGHDLTVDILDVGQGDSILITTPAGQRILVDGGPSGPKLLQDLSRELPSGTRRIDLMVLTHPQEDHVAGLVDVAERYDVQEA
ncbi:MAG TPA: ComEC/Rec2 family competence protein, partial [Dehalococcoidia bacterium]